jgi:protein required for attachment to host cells
MVTDRDIVVRGIAKGRPADETRLDEVMTRDPDWCFEDQPIDEVLEQMRGARIRRVPVLDHEHHLVGMLSLGDVALRADGEGAGIVLQEVSEPRQGGTAGVSGASGNADAGAQEAPMRMSRTGARPLEIEPRAGQKTVWVVVADEAIARILQWPEYGDELQSVEELTDPAAHAKEGDLQRDSTGRRAGPAAQGARQNSPHRLRSSASLTASAGQDQQHLEAQTFARRLAQHLAEAQRGKRFDELRIVAAPRFLGHLRKELDAHVSAAVTDELNKDLVHASNSELTKRLFNAADEGRS